VNRGKEPDNEEKRKEDGKGKLNEGAEGRGAASADAPGVGHASDYVRDLIPCQ
jgi:hypothetical protein